LVGGVVGFLTLAAANAMLELALLGALVRSARVAGTASAAGGGGGERLREALVTTFSAFPSFDTGRVVLGVAGGAALVATAWFAGRGGGVKAAMAAVIAGVVMLERITSGLGFWPGLLATTPLAAVGLALGWPDARRRLVLLLAVVPLPLVFAFQFRGGALPQWGGRYLLTTGLLLAAVGVSTLPDMARWARYAFVGAAIAVTVVGVAWVGVRTHQVGDAVERLARRPEQVVVFPDGFLSREFAAIYGDQDWLAPRVPGELDDVTEVIERSGRTTFALVSVRDDATPPAVQGFHLTRTDTEPFLGPVELTIWSYAADG
jgi:hypothetical protein